MTPKSYLEKQLEAAAKNKRLLQKRFDLLEGLMVSMCEWVEFASSRSLYMHGPVHWPASVSDWWDSHKRVAAEARVRHLRHVIDHAQSEIEKLEEDHGA